MLVGAPCSVRSSCVAECAGARSFSQSYQLCMSWGLWWWRFVVGSDRAVFAVISVLVGGKCMVCSYVGTDDARRKDERSTRNMP